MANQRSEGWQDCRSTEAPAPEARFRVLDSAGITGGENTERIHGRSNLVMGVLYSKHGLIDEAEREFEALVRANPESLPSLCGY